MKFPNNNQQIINKFQILMLKHHNRLRITPIKRIALILLYDKMEHTKKNVSCV